VDDEPDMRFLLRLQLDSDDRFEVVGEAEDGLEALECCRTMAPDVVIMDVRMPRLDGVAALPLLREACPGVRVALFTACIELIDSDLLRSHDAVAFDKGASIAWLADRLHELAASHPFSA
jgi:DNA-binding NarL/FixJ family response regulator